MTLLQREAEEYQKSFRAYAKAAWPTIEPATPLVWGWSQDAICDHLQAQTRGDIRRLLINVIPRGLKSILVSVLWPTWEWTLNPWQKWLHASYSDRLSLDHAVLARRVLRSGWYQARWGHRVQLSEDQDQKDKFDTTAGGYRISTTIGGTSTGLGGNRIVIDDPHNVKQAESDAVRTATTETWKRSFSNRGNDPKTVTKTVVMQRVHSKDLSGVLLEEGGWEHLMLPMEFEPKRRCRTSLPFVDPRTKPGELLQPERMGPEEVAAQKKDSGPYAWAGQYQQNPSPLEGGLFKRKWWKRWRTTAAVGLELELSSPLPRAFDFTVISVDCTFKDMEDAKGKDPDYVAIGVVSRKGPDYFVRYLVHAQMGLPETIFSIREVRALFPDVSAVVVEDKANGPAVIRQLKTKMHSVIEVNPQGGKIARAVSIQGRVQSGNVYLPVPEEGAWSGPFIEEFASFPNGDHDDRVDMLSQALIYMDANEVPASVNVPAGVEGVRRW